MPLSTGRSVRSSRPTRAWTLTRPGGPEQYTPCGGTRLSLYRKQESSAKAGDSFFVPSRWPCFVFRKPLSCNTHMTKQADLLAYVFEAQPHVLSATLMQWMED